MSRDHRINADLAQSRRKSEGLSEWERIFADPMAAAAAIDWAVHRSVILEFDVPSCGLMQPSNVAG